MEDTCKKPDCHLWKKYGEKCPNYYRTGWREKDSSQEIIVHDCSPVRTMLMLQDISNRLIGVQQAGEQTRNVIFELGQIASQMRIEHKE